MASKLVLRNGNNEDLNIIHNSIDGPKTLATGDFEYIRSTIKDIHAIPHANDKDVLFVEGYHSINDGGGGKFIFNASLNTINHNGGTIIDPTKVFPSDWTNVAERDEWFTGVNEGFPGCWVRVKSNYIKSQWFGFTGTEENCLKAAADTKQLIYMDPEDYVLSTTSVDFTGKNFFSFGSATINNSTIIINKLGTATINKAATPSISITDTLDEGETATGTFTIKTGEQIHIGTSSGSITAVTYNTTGDGGTFKYTAPKGLTADQTCSISAYATNTAAGKTQSDTVTDYVNVKYVKSKAANPTLSIIGPVKQGQTLTGGFSVADNETITISANIGTISNVNYSTHTFLYTAPATLDGDSNETATIYAYANKALSSQSDTVSKQVVVEYVKPTSTAPSITIPSPVKSNSSTKGTFSVDTGDSIHLSVDHGTIGSVIYNDAKNGGTFMYQAPTVTSDQTYIISAYATGDNKNTSDTTTKSIEVDAVEIKLNKPSITIASPVDENTVTTGNFTCNDGETIHINAYVGTNLLSNAVTDINYTTHAFKFHAPSTDNSEGENVTLKAYVSKTGSINSDETETTVKINYVESQVHDPTINIGPTVDSGKSITGNYTIENNSTIHITSSDGTISGVANTNSTSGTFIFNAPILAGPNNETVTITAYATKINETDSNKVTASITVLYVEPKATTPVITVASDVINQGETTSGTYKIDPGNTITIAADHGTISDQSNPDSEGHGTFKYTAPDTISGSSDLIVTITAQALVSGKADSDESKTTITVKNLNLKSDSAIINNNYTNNEDKSINISH